MVNCVQLLMDSAVQFASSVTQLSHRQNTIDICIEKTRKEVRTAHAIYVNISLQNRAISFHFLTHNPDHSPLLEILKKWPLVIIVTHSVNNEDSPLLSLELVL